MAKIVYLFGAGASVGPLPLVSEMKNRIDEVIETISKGDLLLSDSERFENLAIGEFQSKRKHQESLIEGLKELKLACDTHYSIDTYAKKLSIRQDIEGLKKLKVLLCFFFVVEQIIHPPNPRYDFFFASLIDSIDSLPDNIKILTWNYDTQFEIAFAEFSQNYDIAENQRLLKVHKRNVEFGSFAKGGFGIYKLNGSTEFKGGLRSVSYNYNLKVSPSLTQGLLEQMVKNYVAFTYIKDYSPIFSFAWEESFSSVFMDTIIEEVRDAEVLVVIGYSFPYFNRSIDRLIIRNMRNLSKVYFQSPSANELIDRFKSVRDDLSSDKLIPIKDKEYFYVPNEL